LLSGHRDANEPQQGTSTIQGAGQPTKERRVNEYDLVRAVLAAAAVPEEAPLGRLHVTPTRAVLHFDPACRPNRSTPPQGQQARLKDLMESADATKFSVCSDCLVRPARTTAAARWRDNYNRIRRTHARRNLVTQAAEEQEQGGIYAYARSLLIAADTFTEDDPDTYIAGRGPSLWQGWHTLALQTLHDTAWTAGQAQFEQLLAAGAVSRHLGRSPHTNPGTLVVAGKGTGFLRQTTRRMLQNDQRLYYAAILEGPRLAQTKEWFVTTAPWEGNEVLPDYDPPRLIDRPEGSSGAAISTALSLWDGSDTRDLEAIIVSAEHALHG
jgi:hypothetical protein